MGKFNFFSELPNMQFSPSIPFKDIKEIESGLSEYMELCQKAPDEAFENGKKLALYLDDTSRKRIALMGKMTVTAVNAIFFLNVTKKDADILLYDKKRRDLANFAFGSIFGAILTAIWSLF
jgi:hypothetical protein|nr:MAG TPA: hypothetical protein [Caudoviricetes sp.]